MTTKSGDIREALAVADNILAALDEYRFDSPAAREEQAREWLNDAAWAAVDADGR